MKRRNLLSSLGVLIGGATSFVAFGKKNLILTPRQTEGPFYPQYIPNDIESDLTLFDNIKNGKAHGEILNLSGTVMDENGHGQPGVLVEIWQADANGVYHYRESLPTQADKNFQGYGRIETDEEGKYKFITIKPGLYPGRTPHIHFKLSHNGNHLLTTQMYFAEESKRNYRDGIYSNMRTEEQDAVTITLPDGHGIRSGHFDIVV